MTSDANVSDTNLTDTNATATYITDPLITVIAKAIGSSTLVLTSKSGEKLSIVVTVTDIPTLSLDKTTLSIEINAVDTVTATATTDGVTTDTISATTSNASVFTVSVSNSVISVTGVAEGVADLVVTSSTGKSAVCTVTVNAYVALNEDPNSYANTTYASAYTLPDAESVNDVVSENADWYKFETVVGIYYEVKLKKFADIGKVEAKVYSNPESTELFVVSVDIEDAQNEVVYTFRADDTLHYIRVINFLGTDQTLNLESIEYEISVTALEPITINNPSALTVDDGYILGVAEDDNGTSYTLSAEYGKMYEVWVYDAASQLSNDYTLDIMVTAYTEDKKQTYFSQSNQPYDRYEFIIPNKTQEVVLQVQPLNSGETGTYAIKIVEKTATSDGMMSVPFPMLDGIPQDSKVGLIPLYDKWSYYSTDALSSVTKTILVSNISPAEDLSLVIYEDSSCETIVESANSGISGMVSITHKYTKTGQFCIGVENTSLTNEMVYEIKVSGEKEEGINTYTSTTKELIPDNEVDILSSKIEIKYGILAIQKITVGLNITHTYDSDLLISLVSPAGTEVVLSANRGDVEDNYIMTTFDDSATISISDVVNAVAPFAGLYIPETPLSALNGEPADGIWSLNIQDRNDGNSGTLDSWSLTIE